MLRAQSILAGTRVLSATSPVFPSRNACASLGTIHRVALQALRAANAPWVASAMAALRHLTQHADIMG